MQVGSMNLLVLVDSAIRLPVPGKWMKDQSKVQHIGGDASSNHEV